MKCAVNANMRLKAIAGSRTNGLRLYINPTVISALRRLFAARYRENPKRRPCYGEFYAFPLSPPPDFGHDATQQWRGAVALECRI